MVYPQMKESEEHELLTQMNIYMNSSPTQLDAYIKPLFTNPVIFSECNMR